MPPRKKKKNEPFFDFPLNYEHPVCAESIRVDHLRKRLTLEDTNKLEIRIKMEIDVKTVEKFLQTIKVESSFDVYKTSHRQDIKVSKNHLLKIMKNERLEDRTGCCIRNCSDLNRCVSLSLLHEFMSCL